MSSGAVRTTFMTTLSAFRELLNRTHQHKLILYCVLYSFCEGEPVVGNIRLNFWTRNKR